MLTSKLYCGFIIYGPYVDIDGRRYVNIYKNKLKYFTMYYSRYIMQEHLGRILPREEEVDHRDNDFTNDTLDNLQILTTAENVGKSNANRAIYPKIAIYICFQCGKEFPMNRNQQSNHERAKKQGRYGPFCGRSCASKFTNTLR